MKPFHILIILSFTLAISSCGKHENVDLAVNYKPANSELRIELPDTVQHPYSVYSILHNEHLLDELGMPTLTHGTDSFELRINSQMDILKCGYGQMLVIKKQNGRWICREYQYLIDRVPFENERNERDYYTRFTIDTILIYNRYPVSGIDSLLHALERENIYSLPDMQDIPAADSIGIAIADGVSYTIEFATQNQYKFYTYASPQHLTKYFTECQYMSNILAILDREIGVKDELEEILQACDSIHHRPFKKANHTTH